MATLTAGDKKLIDSIVAAYVEPRAYDAIELFRDLVLRELLGAMRQGRPLGDLIHSIKNRLKDPDHLRDKLARKLLDCKEKGKRFAVTPQNLRTQITDLAGCRILHLHTRQMDKLHSTLLQLIQEAQWVLVEPPFAYVWDEEHKVYFKSIGIRVRANDRLYSSVHYVVMANRKEKITCEIQVRTLADELWGEMDHRLNYPHRHPSTACREQLAALARVTSGCGRLVDAIVASNDEWEANQKRGRRA